MQDQAATDNVQLPARDAFISTPTSTLAESYYSTLLRLITASVGRHSLLISARRKRLILLRRLRGRPAMEYQPYRISYHGCAPIPLG